MTVQYNEEVESLQQVLPSSWLKPLQPKPLRLKRSCAGSRRFVPTHDGRSRHNGVNGDDLLAMTAATLTGDLRVSPFLAQKMLNARDCYLDAAVM